MKIAECEALLDEDVGVGYMTKSVEKGDLFSSAGEPAKASMAQATTSDRTVDTPGTPARPAAESGSTREIDALHPVFAPHLIPLMILTSESKYSHTPYSPSRQASFYE